MSLIHFNYFGLGILNRRLVMLAIQLFLLAGALKMIQADEVSYQAAFSPATPSQLRDMETIKGRLVAGFQTWIPVKQAQEAIGLMRDDGSFPDINYPAVANLGFPQAVHIKRLEYMAMAFANPQSPLYQNVDLKVKISKGLDYWFAQDPQTKHHWFMTIGLPQDLAEVLLLFEKNLTPAQLKHGLRMLERGYSQGQYVYESRPATGQNLEWTAKVMLIAGCLQKNYGFALQAASKLNENIQVTRDEGVQPDFSFHQHGPLLYSGGYGAAYAQDSMSLLAITRDTSFAPSLEQIQILVQYMLDGEQWMTRNYAWDFSTLGRGLVDYKATTDGMKDFLKAVHGLSAVAPDRKIEIEAFAQRLLGNSEILKSGLTGNRAYWASDYMAHQRPEYFYGIRVFSKRTYGDESGNGANLKGYYLGSGVTCLMRTGKEYSGIFPLWNWRQLPGTTCAQSANPYPPITWGGPSRGTTDFAGGVSDGTYGAMALDFNRDGIVAKKGWFCFDHEIVCLGAGITATVSDPIDTTIEQNWHDGDLAVAGAQGPIVIAGTTPANLSHARWLLHGTTGYYFPTPQAVKVATANRTGNRHDVDATAPPAEVTTGDVFTAWIEHGVKPVDASYAYMVLPVTDAAQLASYQPPQLLANTAQLQAAWSASSRVLEAVFYSPGNLTIPSGPNVKVDQPCAVLVQATKWAWRVTVSDPSQLLKQVGVAIGETKLTYNLPQGTYAGQSITQSTGPAAASAQ